MRGDGHRRRRIDEQRARQRFGQDGGALSTREHFLDEEAGDAELFVVQLAVVVQIGHVPYLAEYACGQIRLEEKLPGTFTFLLLLIQFAV